LTAAERDDLALEVLLTCSILRETANTLERAALLLRPPRLAPSRPVYPQFRGRDE
jgi:hypothetical protein